MEHKDMALPRNLFSNNADIKITMNINIPVQTESTPEEIIRKIVEEMKRRPPGVGAMYI